MRQLDIATTTHGRVLLDDGPSAGPIKLLAGFHGYGQNAEEMMAELRRIAPTDVWTLASVQGLHRFYRPRSETTVASWMTSEDRETLIADNIAYVEAVVSTIVGTRAIDCLVFCGFSQGVAMAFRAAVRGRFKPAAIVALGGDVPPELLEDSSAIFPRVLLARGTDDMFYRKAHMDADVSALEDRGGRVDAVVFDGGHTWHDHSRRAAAALLDEVARSF
jgi:predicted esterase